MSTQEPNMNFYKTLDWPKPPVEFRAQMLEYVNTATSTRKGKWLPDKYEHLPAPENIQKWCRENLPITDDYEIIVQQFKQFDRIPFHIDRNRSEVSQFLLSETGPVTQWAINGEIVASTVFNKHEWAWINADILHEINDVNGDRIALCVYQIREIPLGDGTGPITAEFRDNQ